MVARSLSTGNPTRARTRPAMLFDVEGTLVDCVSATVRCWQETLRELGFEFTLDELHAHSGQDGHDMLRELLPPEAATRLSDPLLEAQGERYRRRYLPGVKAFPSVRALFAEIKARGRPIGLATTCSNDELRHYQGLLNVRDLVDAVACGEDIKHDKPDPALVKLALRRLDLQNEQAWMVGDTPFDALAAGRAGVGAIGLLTGGFSKAALERAGCARVFCDATDLLGNLDTICPTGDAE
jgi:phosphoglycolate phosphatase-like HAD superfamily hydrolase